MSREFLTECRRIIVKIGTTSLTYSSGRLNFQRISKLAWVLTDIRNSGRDVILVSSGAIAVGSDRLGLPERPRDIRGKQAASAVGQAVLIQIYENFFMEYNQKVAQILLTRDVIDCNERKSNARNTFTALFEMGVIPIVNENDTIATEELGFSDNDTLSAYVARIVDGDLLVILSDIDGLYTDDPHKNNNAKLLPEIRGVSRELYDIAGGAGSSLGTGGMHTKIMAADIASSSGINTIIASGENPEILLEILKGQTIGTLIRSER